MSNLLLDPTGPLSALHSRVLEAGCEVDPEWNPLKVLFIPCTETQMNELQGLATQGISEFQRRFSDWTVLRGQSK